MKVISFMICLLSLVMNSFGQKSYYEFNNPNSSRINKSSIQKLVSTVWVADSLFLTSKNQGVRKSFHKGSIAKYRLSYKKDGSYVFFDIAGRWSIKHRKFLDHTVISLPGEHSIAKNFGGVYALKILNDSTLVLSRTISSQQDAFREIKFVSLEVYLERPSAEEKFTGESTKD